MKENQGIAIQLKTDGQNIPHEDGIREEIALPNNLRKVLSSFFYTLE